MQITKYLDHDLRAYDRVREMAKLADEVAARPVDEVLTDLRAVLAERQLTGEDHQRLHVLISQLYHASADVTGPLVGTLRTEVTQAWKHSRDRASLLELRKE